jgi:hypothetical protein
MKFSIGKTEFDSQRIEREIELEKKFNLFSFFCLETKEIDQVVP